jgi:hypothetical protein
MRIQYASRIKNFITFFDTTETILNQAMLFECMWYFEAPGRSRNFVEAFKSETQTSQIWLALNQVVKGTRHFRQHYQQPVTKNISACLFPVIIFDGQLFQAQLESGNITLEPAVHVVVEFDYISKDEPFKTEQFLVDVVHKQYMTEYFKKADTCFSKAIEHLRTAFSDGKIQLEA